MGWQQEGGRKRISRTRVEEEGWDIRATREKVNQSHKNLGRWPSPIGPGVTGRLRSLRSTGEEGLLAGGV